MIALLLASAAAPAAYPSKAVFDAFAQVCRSVSDFPAAERAARAKGWREATPDADPHLAKLVTLGLEQGAGGRKSGTSFARMVKGRTLYLVLSRYEDDKVWGDGCHLYDFAAPAAIDQPELEGWMRRPATFRQAQEGVLVKLSWAPAESSGWRGAAVDAAYVPTGSPLTEQTGLAGVVLVAQANGRVAP